MEEKYMGAPFPIYSGVNCWSQTLEPNPNGGWRSKNMEDLDHYLSRVRPVVPNLHAQVIEQWVYRHFNTTRFRNIPLEQLSSRLERWPSKKILNISSAEPSQNLHDEINEHNFFAKWRTSSAQAFKEFGTWDVPILIMANKEGFLEWDGSLAPFKYWLIEGHKRFRLLNYYHAHSKARRDHEVWLIELRVE